MAVMATRAIAVINSCLFAMFTEFRKPNAAPVFLTCTRLRNPGMISMASYSSIDIRTICFVS